MQGGLLFERESYLIRAACFEVYKEKGCGFLEGVYHECLMIEFRIQGIPFVSKKELSLDYKCHPLEAKYQPDFVCFDSIILEIKAAAELTDGHRAQVQNYLCATGLQLAFLVNFGHFPGVQIERIVSGTGRYNRIPAMPN